MRVDKTIWLVAGNKGNVGKSVVAKALVEWHQRRQLPLTVVDGDSESGDVLKAFRGRVESVSFDLGAASGWAQYADWLCDTKPDGQIITNLPDGVTEKTLMALERYRPAVEQFGYVNRALFVMNTLPDGLRLLPRLVKAVRYVYPVKNLFFGRSAEFHFFDREFGRHFPVTTIYFPRLYPAIMNSVRISGMGYGEVLGGGQHPCQTLYARLELAGWVDRALEAMDEVLLEDVDVEA